MAFALSTAQTKEYESTATLLFRDTQFDQKLFGSSFNTPSPDPTREAATNLGLVSLKRVATITAAALGHTTPARVADATSISANGQSNLVNITASDRDPQQAARIATTFARSYVTFRRDADRAAVKGAVQLLRRQLAALGPSQRSSARGRDMAQQLERLQVLSALQTGNAEVVQPAQVPSSPARPRTWLNTVAAGLLGLLLGLALAYLAQRLDRRVHDPETVEEILGKPVIASVPRARSLVQALAGPSTIEAAPAEAFRTLRTNLRYFDLGRPIKSIVVASAMEGEGKSTVAWYLAAAAAETGADVLLIEADLRRPTFAERLPTSLGGPGLAQAIAEGSPLRTVARRTQTTADDIAFSSEIDVVPAGDMPPNPSELLASPVARELISDAVAAYDLVVIDTPPATVVSDATPLMSIADAVLVVVRLRRTRRDRLAQLRDLLDSLGAPLIGAVVNDAKTHARYGYEYKARAPSSRTRGVGERDRGRPIGARSADATDSQERESGVTRMQS